MVESFLKGGILLFAKDAIIRGSKTVGISDVPAGILGGFGGGVSQVIVLGPCTYLVTASVNAEKGTSVLKLAQDTFSSRGIRGFYHGGVALMLRQGTNWASRQAFTDAARKAIRARKSDPKAKLSLVEEASCGIVGTYLQTHTYTHISLTSYLTLHLLRISATR